MANLTDPADELASIARDLRQSSSFTGAKLLSNVFDVEEASTEFYTIIAAILNRCDHVGKILKRSDWAIDKKVSAVRELDGFKSAFRIKALTSQWNNGSDGGLRLIKDHGKVIEFWSPEVRKVECYPLLNSDEIGELRELISDYLQALRENEDLEPFVRHAIVDGLAKLDFSLKHLGWVGADYNLEAFRQVLLQYNTLNEQSRNSSLHMPVSVIKGFFSILKSAKDKYDTAESWTNTANSAYENYKIASGLLTPILLTYNP